MEDINQDMEVKASVSQNFTIKTCSEIAGDKWK
jgi:hypothetical protein